MKTLARNVNQLFIEFVVDYTDKLGTKKYNSKK